MTINKTNVYIEERFVLSLDGTMFIFNLISLDRELDSMDSEAFHADDQVPPFLFLNKSMEVK
jgi:hypothetical protein